MQSELHLLNREATFLKLGEKLYNDMLDELHKKDNELSSLPPPPSISLNMNQQDEQAVVADLEIRLRVAKEKKKEAIHARMMLEKKIHQNNEIKDGILHRVNQLSYEFNELNECVDSFSANTAKSSESLNKLMQINVINDAFFIWYSGSFATINNFRLGNLPSKPIEWTEINAALGQAVLVVSIIAEKADVRFKRYNLSPMGSFSKITSEDKRTSYSLFTDGSFSLFPKRNFNAALTGFITCVQELGEHVVKHDPTLCLPYNIDVDDSKIGDISFLLGVDDEIWTRALKFLLADIKWIIAWASKHLSF